ncbi:MAG: methyltransferase [Bryobacteraceae bacterium]|jgi:protein-S-isoprenylcysteine O-methyltransferase Ste14
MMATGVAAALTALLHLAGLCLRPASSVWLAAGLYAAGLALFWWAVAVTRGRLAACGTGRRSLLIVKRGPYAFVRHPFYASYNLVWLAGFVATSWWPVAATAILMAVIYEKFAREEEKAYVDGDFAAEYWEYRNTVGKYLPRIRMRLH